MSKDDKNFKNKVVLITGASSGLGAALAQVFAKEQAKLALLARRIDKLQALVAQCEKSNTKALAIACDVTQDQDLPNAVQKIHDAFGLIDVVIANAGFGVVDYAQNLSLADYQRQFETNVFGVLRTIYASLADLKKTKGRIVIIGSALGHVAIPQYAAYSMSKFAITALAQTLYEELAAQGISVTLISPGYVTTEFRNINNEGVFEENNRPPAPSGLSMDVHKAAK
ncbi:MAG: SDR family NAD(P)-dependent oxidoreductase, partial [Candidatus Berkiella sp.]